MTSAERQLEILRAVDAIADDVRTLSQLSDGLGRWLTSALSAADVVIAPIVERSLAIPAGAAKELRGVLEEVGAPSPEWRELVRGDVIVRALRPNAEPVGLVAVRKPGGLNDDDRSAWRIFEERADSALEHAIERETLRDRSLELETIYAIDHIRDEQLPFVEMLQRTMQAVLRVVAADCALVALRELSAPHDELQLHVRAAEGKRQETGRFIAEHRSLLVELVQRAFSDKQLVVSSVGEERRRRAAGGALTDPEAPGAPLERSDQELLCVPLILDEEIIGGFVLLGPEGERFSSRDHRLFQAVCSQADTAIFEDVARQRLRNVFKRYVSPDVVSELLKHDEDFLRGRRREVSCFFSDLRGFTTVSEKLDVDVVVDMLNEHLQAMTEVVFQHGGTVDKFIGDCVMAFFGAPLHQPDHALRAVRCADRMRSRHNEIAAGWEKRGLPNVKIGIGLHSGEVFVGSIGGEALSSYTIIGDHVNLAARLEGESGPDDIIITEATLDSVRAHVDVESRGEVTVKGKSVPSKIYNVLRMR